MPLKGVKYRYKRGTHIRLAFKNGQVVEAKNTKTGKVHTPAEFRAERRRKKRTTPKKRVGGKKK